MGESERFPTVDKVELLAVRGPWKTKSGGILSVLFAFPPDILKRFFRYDEEELKQIPEDIRGLRSYTVRNLPKGKIGGKEFHRIREEIVFGLEGSVRWKCEDLFGGMREFTVTSNNGIWMPPGILHTYHVLRNKSGLLIVANTLFNPENLGTHDTYFLKEFERLKKERKLRRL